MKDLRLRAIRSALGQFSLVNIVFYAYKYVLDMHVK